MFFFYSIHNKNNAKTPAIDAQPHPFVVFQPFPIRLVLPVAVYVFNNHHRVFIFENQFVIIDEVFQFVIQIIVKTIVIPSGARNLLHLFQHILIKPIYQRRVEVVFPLSLDTIFQITDNHF